ncbi:hypothetical protein LshimejAT787_0705350 [Lyophyllum shimeji]|uniref:Uncharacterized protein n=1 Tax=Lyophyllum shimeji TaxID=47721 RepID=A0A9P3PQ69_LYOSH|nr:hypothetical protein LshimejAT787_0705350 [Lyophyllum shimeji]
MESVQSRWKGSLSEDSPGSPSTPAWCASEGRPHPAITDVLAVASTRNSRRFVWNETTSCWPIAWAVDLTVSVGQTTASGWQAGIRGEPEGRLWKATDIAWSIKVRKGKLSDERVRLRG